MSAESQGAISCRLILPGQWLCPREALAEPGVKDMTQIVSYASTPQMVPRLSAALRLKVYKRSRCTQSSEEASRVQKPLPEVLESARRAAAELFRGRRCSQMNNSNKSVEACRCLGGSITSKKGPLSD